jgi:acetyltransferase
VYLRYFCSLSLTSRVAHERLVRICFVDYDREIAMVADHKDPKTGQHHVLGVGRLIKLHAGNEGEVAVVVSDERQKQGLGMELFRRVVQVAQDEKLSRVTAEILPDNVAMQTIAKRLGFRWRLTDDPSVLRAVLEF